MNGWTPERRARQAQAIRRWRPWEHSTGPRTAVGKARSARNAYTASHWRLDRELLKTLRQALREQREALLELCTEPLLFGLAGPDLNPGLPRPCPPLSLRP